MALLRSKLTLLVMSAVLVGSAAAMLAVMSTIRPPSYSSPQVANSSTGGSSGTNTTGAAAATTAGHKAGGTPGATAPGAGAMPTSTSVPTPRPTRTPTPIPVVGQQLTVRGDVASVDTGTNTFVVDVGGGGGTYKVTVSPPGTSGTSWTGPIVPLSTLNSDTPTPGARATVTGIFGGNGALDATNGTVYAYIDN